MKSFKDWQGQLMGTFHTSPGGIKTVIQDIRATNKEVATIYYQHPHHPIKNTQTGQYRTTSTMSVRAYPPDVFEWLKTYKHVSVPDALSAKILVKDSMLLKALDFVVRAELKEPLEKELPAQALTTGGYGRGKSQMMSMQLVFQQTHKGMVTSPTIVAHRMEPFYFVTLHLLEPSLRTVKTSVRIETAEIVSKLMDVEKFSLIDHDEMYNYLLKLHPTSLAGVWILKPDYFNVLQVYDPTRWQSLRDHVEKGIVSNG